MRLSDKIREKKEKRKSQMSELRMQYEAKIREVSGGIKGLAAKANVLRETEKMLLAKRNEIMAERDKAVEELRVSLRDLGSEK